MSDSSRSSGRGSRIDRSSNSLHPPGQIVHIAGQLVKSRLDLAALTNAQGHYCASPLILRTFRI